MKLSPVLLPGDAAALLEAQIPMLDAIEKADDPAMRAEGMAKLRAWIAQTTAGLRGVDPIAQGKPAAPAPATDKKPCDCDETKQETKEPPKSRSRVFGETLARAALDFLKG